MSDPGTPRHLKSALDALDAPPASAETVIGAARARATTIRRNRRIVAGGGAALSAALATTFLMTTPLGGHARGTDIEPARQPAPATSAALSSPTSSPSARRPVSVDELKECGAVSAAPGDRTMVGARCVMVPGQVPIWVRSGGPVKDDEMLAGMAASALQGPPETMPVTVPDPAKLPGNLVRQLPAPDPGMAACPIGLAADDDTPRTDETTPNGHWTESFAPRQAVAMSKALSYDNEDFVRLQVGTSRWAAGIDAIQRARQRSMKCLPPKDSSVRGTAEELPWTGHDKTTSMLFRTMSAGDTHPSYVAMVQYGTITISAEVSGSLTDAQAVQILTAYVDAASANAKAAAK